jgi:3-oxoacyl-[acyl-carrier-protein] synthase III
MTQYAPAIEICCCQNCDAEGHPKETIRQLTTEEIQQRETDAANFAAEQAEREAAEIAKAAAKASAEAKLAELGLTSEEIRSLI